MCYEKTNDKNLAYFPPTNVNRIIFLNLYFNVDDYKVCDSQSVRGVFEGSKNSSNSRYGFIFTLLGVKKIEDHLQEERKRTNSRKRTS